jgi:hypothetical protein
MRTRVIHPRPLANVAIFTALLAASFIFFAVSMDRNVNVYDEGLILTGAMHVLAGDIPHRDFFTMYGPGFYYTLAALFKLFGPSVLVERVLDILLRACCVALIYQITRRAAPTVCAVAAALVAMVWLTWFVTYGYPLFAALATSLASLTFLLSALENRRPVSSLFVSGMFAGLTVLFRYDIGFLAFIAASAVLAVATWLRFSPHPARRRVTTRTLAVFCSGLAVVTVPVAITLAAAGAIPDLVFDVVTFSSQTYPRMRSLPFPGIDAISSDPEALAVYLPLLICAAAIPSIVAMSRRANLPQRDETEAQPGSVWTPVALLLLTLALYTKGLVRVSPTHMAMPIVTGICLLAVVSQPVAQRRWFGRVTIALALLTTAALTAPKLTYSLRLMRLNSAWAMQSAAWSAPPDNNAMPLDSCRMPADLTVMDCFPVPPSVAATVRYVHQYTNGGDSIYVGLPRHDKIFVGDILLYFIAQRLSATKWYELNPGLQTTAQIQQRIIDEFQHNPPKMVVLVDAFSAVNEPNASAVSSGVHLLDDYIKDHFELAANVSPYAVLRPREADTHPP